MLLPLPQVLKYLLCTYSALSLPLIQSKTPHLHFYLVLAYYFASFQKKQQKKCVVFPMNYKAFIDKIPRTLCVFSMHPTHEVLNIKLLHNECSLLSIMNARCVSYTIKYKILYLLFKYTSTYCICQETS